MAEEPDNNSIIDQSILSILNNSQDRTGLCQKWDQSCKPPSQSEEPNPTNKPAVLILDTDNTQIIQQNGSRYTF